jgi:hypothetical protein
MFERWLIVLPSVTMCNTDLLRYSLSQVTYLLSPDSSVAEDQRTRTIQCTAPGCSGPSVLDGCVAIQYDSEVSLLSADIAFKRVVFVMGNFDYRGLCSQSEHSFNHSLTAPPRLVK